MVRGDGADDRGEFGEEIIEKYYNLEEYGLFEV